MVAYGCMTFLAKLRKLMKAKGLTNKELGPMIGTYPERISKWFGGQGSPDIHQALRIARALQVPMEYLADDDLDEIPDEPGVSPDEQAILDLCHALELDKREALRRLATPVPERLPEPPTYKPGPAYIGPTRIETEADERRQQEYEAAKRRAKEERPVPVKNGGTGRSSGKSEGKR